MDYNNYQVTNYQSLFALSQQTNERVQVDPRLNNFNSSGPSSSLIPSFPPPAIPPPQPEIKLPSFSQKCDPEINQQFINTWLLKKGKLQPGMYLNARQSNIKRNRNEIQINVAKKSLKECLEIIQKLDQTYRQLCDSVETISSADWKQKSQEVAYLRDDFDKTMLKFEDKQSLMGLKNSLRKRAKKRQNQKRRKQNRREEQVQEAENRMKLHKKIDEWLESKKEETERARMDEKLKKDADCVLDEVTKKKSEARKQLSLISALVKLRNVRDSMAVQRGEKPSLEDRRAFGSVTEKLVRMWENAYQNYAKEEQCLRIMLEHNAMEDSKAAKTAKESKIVEEWDQLLFGPKLNFVKNPTYWALTSAERDLETFVAIRKSWDTFLTKSTNKMGSSIPMGWVLPPSKPNDGWTKYLKR